MVAVCHCSVFTPGMDALVVEYGWAGSNYRDFQSGLEFKMVACSLYFKFRIH